MDSPRLTNCTLIITPLPNVSKEHNQPNSLWKRSKKKNQKLQNRYTGSVKSKRNMMVRPSRIEAYKLKMVTKKERKSCAVVSQPFREEKGCTILWSWRMKEVAQKPFCFSEIHILALAFISSFCIGLWTLPCLKSLLLLLYHLGSEQEKLYS